MSNIDKLKPGKYAILFRNNWDGEGDTYETFAILDAEGIWRDEDGDELLEYQGDEVLSAWLMDDGSNVLALLDELEAKDQRIAEHDRKCDEQYLLGMRAGWNFGTLEDADGFDAAYASRSKLIKAERAAAGKGEAS